MSAPLRQPRPNGFIPFPFARQNVVIRQGTRAQLAAQRLAEEDRLLLHYEMGYALVSLADLYTIGSADYIELLNRIRSNQRVIDEIVAWREGYVEFLNDPAIRNASEERVLRAEVRFYPEGRRDSWPWVENVRGGVEEPRAKPTAVRFDERALGKVVCLR